MAVGEEEQVFPSLQDTDPASPRLSQILLDGRPMPGIRDGDTLIEDCPNVGDADAENFLDVVAVVEAICRDSEASIDQNIAQSEQQVVSAVSKRPFFYSSGQYQDTQLLAWLLLSFSILPFSNLEAALISKSF